MAEKLIGACVFAQSGGPTAVINASAYGAITAALDAEEITNVYGAAHGILGILSGTFYDMTLEDRRELELLVNTPSSELGSCRYKMADPDVDDTDYIRLLDTFKKYNIRYFFYNGGNDSMDTCDKVSRYLNRVGYECRVIGIPKTIDNDLCGTDHSPGYGSAAKYIATSIAEVCKDTHVYDAGTITIIEVMGRHAGWLTGAAALAQFSCAPPDLIYLPEITFDLERFFADIDAVYKRKKKCLIAVSEGIRYADGTYVSEAKVSCTDGFGHAQLGGLAGILACLVRERTSAKVRGIEISLLQRCASHLASQTDIDEAVLAGRAAVEAALAGKTGKMIAFARDTVDGQYHCRATLQPLTIVANAEKCVPRDWINEDGNFVTDEFIDYVLPLIQGEPERAMEHGLPRFAQLKKILVK